MNQSSFSDLAYEHKKTTTRKERFLAEMDAILPWDKLLKPILRKYPKPGQCRHPIPAEVMLRIYFLRQWYGLSDPGMEDSLCGVESMRRFAGVDLESIPDETTILKFRHFLEAHRLTEALFRLTRRYLSARGLLLHEGTIVDASIISAPSSTKNRERQRDPEMKQTKKGNAWYFGMKTHIGTDTQGRVHSVAVTHAAVHDSTVMADCLHGEEAVIYGDKAYADAGRRQAAVARGVDWRVNRKARRGKRLSCADRSFNRKSNRTRACVEHAFGVIKHLLGASEGALPEVGKECSPGVFVVCPGHNYLARRELAVT